MSEVSLIKCDPTLKPFFGQIVWNVYYSVSLGMKFGGQRVEIVKEPAKWALNSRPVVSASRRYKIESRRSINVQPDWHLIIWWGKWRLSQFGNLLCASSSSQEKRVVAFRQVRGQYIVKGSFNRETGFTKFFFDLNTLLEIWSPSRRTEKELWSLSGPDEIFRYGFGNGNFYRGPGTDAIPAAVIRSSNREPPTKSTKSPTS
jgi:hypothetical protein